MAFLATETLRLGDGDPLDPDFVKRFLHLVELEGFDDRLDLLHRPLVSISQGTVLAAAHSITHASLVSRQERNDRRVSLSDLPTDAAKIRLIFDRKIHFSGSFSTNCLMRSIASAIASLLAA